MCVYIYIVFCVCICVYINTECSRNISHLLNCHLCCAIDLRASGNVSSISLISLSLYFIFIYHSLWLWLGLIHTMHLLFKYFSRLV